MKLTLTRRAILRGLGSAAVALPTLELTGPSRTEAQASTPPKRFALFYAGMSSSKHGDGEVLTPNNTGTGYDLRRAAVALGSGALPWGGNGFGVQDEVTVASGLLIPWTQGEPGWRAPAFHYNTFGQQVSGVGGRRSQAPHGPSADQLVADELGGATAHRSLSYRVQARRYLNVGDPSGGDSGRISWRAGSGRPAAIDPIVSPRLAYQSLFSGFTPQMPMPTGGGTPTESLDLRRRRSTVDILHARTRALLPLLGREDQARIAAHLDELSAYERRLQNVPAVGPSYCEVPTEPTDPAIGGDHSYNASSDSSSYVRTAGWSGEDQRADLLSDMIHMGFVCDLTRVAAMRITMDQSMLNMNQLVGARGDVHGLTHNMGSYDNLKDCVAWHVSIFARFVAKLRDTQEVDGSSMLDNTVAVLLFEGGYGFDPEDNDRGATHSTENMVAMIAGRVGGLVPGRHIRLPGVHPGRMTLSAMSAVGLPETLGDLTGRIPELFG